MTDATALKKTGEIVAATIEYMATTEGVSVATVIKLIAEGHVNTVKRFNAYMDIATKAVALD